VAEKLGWQVPDDYKQRWVNYPASIWVPQVDGLIEILSQILPPLDEVTGKAISKK
jgi:hypothetical protein